MYFRLLLRRYLSLASPVALAVCFWLFFQHLTWFWLGLLVLAALAITTLTFWYIVGQKFRSLWPFLVLILLFNVGALLFSIFLSRPISRWLLLVVVALFFGMFLESLYRWLWRPRLYQIYSLENLSSFLGLVSLFWFASTFYGFNIFWGVSLWVVSPAIVLLAIFLSFQFFWASSVWRQQNVWYILAIALIVLELFLALSYLPVIFHIASLILVTSWYIAASLVRTHLVNKLTQGLVRNYLITGGILITLALSLAHWR